jgi:flagellar hook assembly protein FlgD
MVREIDLGALEPGEYAVEWDGRDLNGHYASTGVYFYTLRTNLFTQTRKMLLLK